MVPFSFHRRGRVVIEPPSSEQPAEANMKTPSKKKAVKKKSSGPGKKAAAPKKAAAKKTVAKKTAGKPKAPKRAKPAPDDAVIVWRGRKNPFREGTGSHERTERLREHDGQTVAAFIAAGGKRSTVGTCRTRGLVKLAIMKVA
jgi:hypothetical protein